MNIKEVSQQYDISTDTIRYYERVGVIPPITRNDNGYRVFSQTDLNWIYFVKVLRKAGVSIERLVDYRHLSVQGGQTLETRKELLSSQLERINEQIDQLMVARDYLNYKLDNFDTHIATYESSKLNINNDTD